MTFKKVVHFICKYISLNFHRKQIQILRPHQVHNILYYVYNYNINKYDFLR